MHTMTHLAPWTSGCKIVPRKHNECVFSSASHHKVLFGTVWKNHIQLRNKVNWHLKKETFFETFSYLFALWWLKEWDKSSSHLWKHQKAFKMSLCYYTENTAFFFLNNFSLWLPLLFIWWAMKAKHKMNWFVITDLYFFPPCVEANWH